MRKPRAHHGSRGLRYVSPIPKRSVTLTGLSAQVWRAGSWPIVAVVGMDHVAYLAERGDDHSDVVVVVGVLAGASAEYESCACPGWPCFGQCVAVAGCVAAVELAVEGSAAG